MEQTNKYPALNVIVYINYFIALLVGLATLFLPLTADSFGEGVVTFLGGAFFTVMTVAFAEGIKVFLDIERNTRRS